MENFTVAGIMQAPNMMSLQQPVMITSLPGQGMFEVPHQASVALPVMHHQPDVIGAMHGTVGSSLTQHNFTGIIPQQGISMIPSSTGVYSVLSNQ